MSNENKKWKLAFIALFILIIFSSTIVFFVLPSPLKAIDPYDPRFNPDKFRFEDYTVTDCTEEEILAKLFPIGTKKVFVDRVLVKSGGAQTSNDPQSSASVIYTYKIPPSLKFFMTEEWLIKITYNSSNKVDAVTIHPGITHDQSAYDFLQRCQLRNQ